MIRLLRNLFKKYESPYQMMLEGKYAFTNLYLYRSPNKPRAPFIKVCKINDGLFEFLNVTLEIRDCLLLEIINLRNQNAELNRKLLQKSFKLEGDIKNEDSTQPNNQETR